MMLDFNDLYTIQNGDIIHICRIIYYDKTDDTYTVSVRGNGILTGIKEDQLEDISDPLSRDYDILEYIQSDGTQYIDTGLEGKNGYTFKAKVEYTDFVSSYNYLAGFLGTSSNRIYFTKVIKSGSKEGWTFDGDSTASSITAQTNTLYEYESIMETGNQKLYRNGEFIETDKPGTSTVENSYGNIWVFASSSDSGPNGPVACKLYSCSFEYGRKVVRNFVPVKRKSDNKPGLFDTVEKKFYTNLGSEDDFDFNGSFPYKYQTVEYLQSSGTQYINTGIAATDKHAIFLDYQPTTAQSRMYAGARNTSRARSFCINSGNGSTTMYASFGDGGNRELANMTTERVTTYTGKDGIYYNGVKKYTPSQGEWSLSEQICIFAVMQNGTSIDLQSSVKIYSCKIYENNELIRDFVPCYRKRDSEPGLYDKINDVFYTNDGTDSFIVGPDKEQTLPEIIVLGHIIQNSFAELGEISISSQDRNRFNGLSIGDKIPIVLNGTLDEYNIDNYSCYAEIIDFDHNAEVEGYGITFQLCKEDGSIIAFKNSSIDTTINHLGNGTYGGWAGCDLRYDVIGSTNIPPSGYGTDPESGRIGFDATSTCATNPVPNTLMSCLPQELRKVMKPITKWTNNNYQDTYSTAEDSVIPIVDYLPLESEFELFGSRTYANTYEQQHQTQYEYFKTNSKSFYYHNSTTGCTHWDRSPAVIAEQFCYTSVSGTKDRHSISNKDGVSPVFLI